jgi:tetratricopeptide (TPR) repeat protein
VPEEAGPAQGVTITGSVGSVAGDIVGGHKIVHGSTTKELVDELEARGIVRAAETAGLQRRVIITLASRLRPEERLDFEQAVAELERAVEIALEVIKRGQQGIDEDGFVNAVLVEVANRTKNDDLDGAAQALDHALAEVDRQEAKQHQAARRKRMVFLEAAVEQHTLRRDAVAVAARIEMLAALAQPTEQPAWVPEFRQRADTFYDDGETKGINFSLLVVIELARRMASTAGDENERWSAAILLGNALQTLGQRESGTVRLEQAVSVYQDELQEYTRERVPLDWATTQTNLGIALWRLGQRESGTARLEQAITAFRDALQERTPERVPLGWAMTQRNLDNAQALLSKRLADERQV